MISCSAVERCVCCGSEVFRRTLDLGRQPLANAFRKSSSPAEENSRKGFQQDEQQDRQQGRQQDHPQDHPLALQTCLSCWHSQLTHCVDRNAMFTDYAYASGTSNTLRSYFSWFASSLRRGLGLRKARVLEIAANDGSLIRALQACGVEAIGIDPAANLVIPARREGLPVMPGTWPRDASLLGSEPYDVILGLNVLAHVCDPLQFLQGCAARLGENGVVVVQTSQARMFSRGEFDTCYHEHFSFFNTRSMQRLAARAGLAVQRSMLVGIHGDSALWFLGRSEQHARDLASAFTEGEFYLPEDLQDFEASCGIFEESTYHRFAERTQTLLAKLRMVVQEHRSRGYLVVFVGAAAKAITVLHASGIVPDRFLDEAPLKIGAFVPGLDLRVEALEVLRSLHRPALLVITAWNFRAELVDKIRRIGIASASVFYTYFPEELMLGSDAEASSTNWVDPAAGSHAPC